MNVKLSNQSTNAPSPYMADVLEQPVALENLIASMDGAQLEAPLRKLLEAKRVVLAGMGSSHFTTYPIFRAMLAAGIPAWWIDSAELLENLEGFNNPDTVFWLTSQSGESGETTKLLGLIRQDSFVIGITENSDSTLAKRSNFLIKLKSGPEATVSTKSFVNSIAVARVVAAEIVKKTGSSDALKRLTQDSKLIKQYLDHAEQNIKRFREFARDRHLLITGRGEAAISAEAAALILKEASKRPVEGMSAGVLRHGVIELASSNTSVLIFDHSESQVANPDHLSANQALAKELIQYGCEVGWVGGIGANQIAPAGSKVFEINRNLDPMIGDALVFQSLSFALAERSGIEAGSFKVALKINTKI
jgi:glucosamine--fructose-6-phosphate aminotransferase (isomerizing)